MFNIEKIFSIFDEEHDITHENDISFVDYTNHPLFWIGGFNKVILHNEFFKKYIEKIFPLTQQNGEEYSKEASNKLIYTRAWNYIKNIDLDNPLHIDCIKIKSDNKFLLNLDQTILFFENLEEYEKCLHLLDIKKKVEKFLI